MVYQGASLGRWISGVEDAKEQEDQGPGDDVPHDPAFREIEDAPHRPRPLHREAKKPSVSVARLRPSQRYIARGGVAASIPHVRAGRVRRHLGDVHADAPPDPRREPRRDPGLQLLRGVRGPHGPSAASTLRPNYPHHLLLRMAAM